VFRWLEVTNRTGGLVTLAFGGGRCPLAVPPGRWRYEWGTRVDDDGETDDGSG
jgi:hypothetical protein